MSMFEKWKDRYTKGWAAEEHIRRLVNLGVLTQQQYKEITGQEYTT